MARPRVISIPRSCLHGHVAWRPRQNHPQRQPRGMSLSTHLAKEKQEPWTTAHEGLFCLSCSCLLLLSMPFPGHWPKSRSCDTSGLRITPRQRLWTPLTLPQTFVAVAGTGLVDCTSRAKHVQCIALRLHFTRSFLELHISWLTVPSTRLSKRSLPVPAPKGPPSSTTPFPSTCDISAQASSRP